MFHCCGDSWCAGHYITLGLVMRFISMQSVVYICYSSSVSSSYLSPVSKRRTESDVFTVL